MWTTAFMYVKLDWNQRKMQKENFLQTVFHLNMKNVDCVRTIVDVVSLKFRWVNLGSTCNPIENQYLVSGQLNKSSWPQWALSLSPWCGHVILVSGYLVLTGVNWSKHGCPIGHFRKYHNTLYLSPQILHKHCFCFLLLPFKSPKRNWKQCLCNIWGDKQRVLWYCTKWPISKMYALNLHDTSHIGIHGGVDVHTYVWTVDDLIIKPNNFFASMSYHIFLTMVLHTCGAPLLQVHFVMCQYNAIKYGINCLILLKDLVSSKDRFILKLLDLIS